MVDMQPWGWGNLPYLIRGKLQRMIVTGKRQGISTQFHAHQLVQFPLIRNFNRNDQIKGGKIGLLGQKDDITRIQVEEETFRGNSLNGSAGGSFKPIQSHMPNRNFEVQYFFFRLSNIMV